MSGSLTDTGSSGAWDDEVSFTGHVKDAGTGLVYMQARYMDPVTGRFLSSDPVGFAEGGAGYFGRYHYAANDPVNMIDPDGRSPLAFSDPNLFYALDEETRMSDPGYRAGKAAAKFTGEAVGGAKAFGENYNDMIEANTIEADGYFHCKANCEATQLGDGGEIAAQIISDAREGTDMLRGKSDSGASEQDQEANRAGRDGANENPEQSCRATCDSFRPEALDEDY